MENPLWTQVDNYLAEQLLEADAVLETTLSASAAAGLPAISVSVAQGQFLNLLVRMIGAKRILEIGTLGGYSTICLARGMQAGGELVTLEFDPHHAEVATKNISDAGLAHCVEVKVGAALETLPGMVEGGCKPFDLIFIDADKANMPGYLHWSLQLSHPGTVIIGDNVVRDGAVIDSASDDPNIQGVRRFLDLLGSEPRIHATALQTVGSKGYDGFAVALVVS